MSPFTLLVSRIWYVAVRMPPLVAATKRIYKVSEEEGRMIKMGNASHTREGPYMSAPPSLI